jgi:hypothetical protein
VALADEGEFHGIEESQTAADIGGGFTASEIASRRNCLRNFSDGAG